jgi:hypothetical protein
MLTRAVALDRLMKSIGSPGVETRVSQNSFFRIEFFIFWSVKAMSNNVAITALTMSSDAGLDQYLTARPESSLFSYSQKQITKSARLTTRLNFNEKIDWGKRLTMVIPPLADLLTDVTLHMKLPALSVPHGSTYVGWTNAIGHAAIEHVDLFIGEMVIDSQTGLSMEINEYLDSGATLNVRVGRYDTVLVLPQNALTVTELFIPLPFWFTKKLSLALPLIAMKQPVKIVLKLRQFQNLVTFDGQTAPDVQSLIETELIVDYQMLGTAAERTYFSKTPLHYIIDQTQTVTLPITEGTIVNKYDVSRFISRSVKELVFVIVDVDSIQNNDHFNFGQRNENVGGEFISEIAFYIDSKERFEPLPESFYRLVTPFRYHRKTDLNRNIYVMSFAECPESNQASGSLNFSRFDSIEIGLEFLPNVPESLLCVTALSSNRLTMCDGQVFLEFMT